MGNVLRPRSTDSGESRAGQSSIVRGILGLLLGPVFIAVYAVAVFLVFMFVWGVGGFVFAAVGTVGSALGSGLWAGPAGLAALSGTAFRELSQQGLLGAAAGVAVALTGKLIAAGRRRQAGQSAIGALFEREVWTDNLTGTLGLLALTALGGYCAAAAFQALATGDVGSAANTLDLIRMAGVSGGGDGGAGAAAYPGLFWGLLLLIGRAIGFGFAVGFVVGLPAALLYQAFTSALGLHGLVHGFAEGTTERLLDTRRHERLGFGLRILFGGLKGATQSAIGGAISNLALASLQAAGFF
jgi:hypothetical protein